MIHKRRIRVYLPAHHYIVATPSPTDATVTVTLPAIAGMNAFHLDGANQRAGDVGEVKGETFGALFKAG